MLSTCSLCGSQLKTTTSSNQDAEKGQDTCITMDITEDDGADYSAARMTDANPCETAAETQDNDMNGRDSSEDELGSSEDGLDGGVDDEDTDSEDEQVQQ